MKPTTRLIAGTAGVIEVAVQHAPRKGEASDCCAVICHPHPLYGGDMNNKVVTTLARTYVERGIDVVRFNFRGVGRSTGRHDEGRGEVDDLISVCAWMRRESPDVALRLAGYSFGAAIAASGCAELTPSHLELVAPPVGRYGLTAQRAFGCPVFVVVGEQDEVVAATDVARWARGLEPPAGLVILPAAGHFFHGELTALRMALLAQRQADVR